MQLVVPVCCINGSGLVETWDFSNPGVVYLPTLAGAHVSKSIETTALQLYTVATGADPRAKSECCSLVFPQRDYPSF